MGNHYHLLIETRQPTLAKGMREVNGVYTQAFNRHHQRVGHVLQGRYRAILVDQDPYLLELARSIVLHPVRAGFVPCAGESSWSSFQAVMGKTPAPDWLAVDNILVVFHSRRGPASRAYARFVRDGIGAVDPHEEIQRAGILSSEAFMEEVLNHVDRQALSPEIVRKDRPAASLVAVAERNQTRGSAVQEAYSTGPYTITKIADISGMHRRRLSIWMSPFLGSYAGYTT